MSELKRNYVVTGMTCSSCVNHVEKAVKKVSGVKNVNVSLLTNSMEVILNNDIDDKLITNAVKNVGYGIKNTIKNADINDDAKDEESKKLLYILIFSFIFLVPLFYLSMGYMMDWNIGVLKERVLLLAIIEFLLSFIILILNRRFFISGYKSIVHKALSMDTLVSLGSGVAFIYSTVILLMMANGVKVDTDYTTIVHYSMNLNFETAGMVPTLITIGKLLESVSKGKTTSAIRSLAKLSVKEATLIDGDKEKLIKTEDVKVNDILLVRPGEYFPVDGTIISGECSVDESSLTGESIPIYKKINDEVKSSTVNLNGVIKMRATKVGKDTTLNKIIDMVKEASSSKAPITRIADKVSGIFVPTILIIAVITFITWLCISKNFTMSHHLNESYLTYSLNKAISVLVIACPCALGLATPVAIMVGSGKAAKNGILFKNATALENLSHVDFAVFDKTGTITNGKLNVVDVVVFSNEIDKDELLKIAYSIEKNSKHPLAVAINNYAKNNEISFYEGNEFKEISGKGVSIKIDELNYSAISFKTLKELSIEYDEKVLNTYNDLSNEGKTPLIFLKEKQVIGIIALKDTIKDDALKTIKCLKEMNIIPIMLTGDNKMTAKKISSEVQLDYYVSELLPDEKLQIISLLQKQGKVLMIGDGINDAPALTKADSSMAISASDIALDSASIVLLKSSLMDVVGAINLSRYTLLNIKENLFFAFIYNIIMIPIAAGVFSQTNVELLMNMKPYYGALAMSLSSICVVLNALRINLFKLYDSFFIRHKKIKFDDTVLKNENDHEINYQKEVIKIEDMMCENCIRHVKETLESIDGIKDVNVSLKDLNATILKRENVDDNLIIDSIKNIGYNVTDIKKEEMK